MKKQSQIRKKAAATENREPETSGGILGLTDQEHHQQLIRIRPSFEEIRDRVKAGLDREMQAIEDRRSLESDQPPKLKARRAGDSNPRIPATWEELRKRGAIPRREVAALLGRSYKHVGRLTKAQELHQTDKKRIVCDSNLREHIRRERGRHVLP